MSAARLPGDPGLPPGVTQRECDGELPHVKYVSGHLKRITMDERDARDDDHPSPGKPTKGKPRIPLPEQIWRVEDETRQVRDIAAYVAAIVIDAAQSRHEAHAALRMAGCMIDVHHAEFERKEGRR